MQSKYRVDTPMSLLSFLRERAPAPSVKSIKRAIDQKQCKVNGSVERFSTHQLKKGDLVELNLTPRVKADPSAVLFENETLIAFNKSPHTLSDAPSGLFAVHRLDKETSGVLLYAKNEKTQEEICGLFKERSVKKSYLALVDGKVATEEWTVDNFLGKKESYQGGAIYGAVSAKEGKRAITHFRLLKSTEHASLLLCTPITGRTHQIRVHLKISNHPILGDWQYAKKFRCTFEPKRHLLHAYSLTIAGIEIVAPLLEDFTQAYANLFKDPHCQDLRDWRCASDISRPQ